MKLSRLGRASQLPDEKRFLLVLVGNHLSHQLQNCHLEDVEHIRSEYINKLLFVNHCIADSIHV